MSIFQTNISLLNKFLKQFSTCFSKKQLAVFTLFIYALFKDYKRNSLDAMAKATHTDYQKLQYFKIDRYWNLCLTAWTLTYWIKQNAYLSKILETKPTTFNEIKLAVNSIL